MDMAGAGTINGALLAIWVMSAKNKHALSQDPLQKGLFIALAACGGGAATYLARTWLAHNSVAALAAAQNQLAIDRDAFDAIRAVLDAGRAQLADDRAAFAVAQADLIADRDAFEIARAALHADRTNLLNDRAQLDADRDALGDDQAAFAGGQARFDEAEARLAQEQEYCKEQHKALVASQKRYLADRLALTTDIDAYNKNMQAPRS